MKDADHQAQLDQQAARLHIYLDAEREQNTRLTAEVHRLGLLVARQDALIERLRDAEDVAEQTKSRMCDYLALIDRQRVELRELRELTKTCDCNTQTYEGPQADCPIHGAIRAFNETSADLTALAARINGLLADPYEQVPPDGTVWLVTYTGGWQPDRPPREKLWHRLDGDSPHPDGDWWQIGDHNHRYQWLEVIGHDDPPEDRPSVTLEQLIPADEIERALTGPAIDLYRPPNQH